MSADHADVIIVGAGPAGALAATLLARTGVRVTIYERARFPRPKLCGDTLNPGAVSLLRRHFDLGAIERRAVPIDGMLLSGPGPVFVRGTYGPGVRGLAVTREVFDAWLAGEAVRAGATLVEETTASAPLLDERGAVCGVRVRDRAGRETNVAAVMTLAADGRRSRLGESCGLSTCAAAPRRWAVGAYFDEVDALGTVGEMHVRHGHYLGVAPALDGRANACLVEPLPRGGAWRDPDSLLAACLAGDPVLGPRFARARAATRAVVLGPLAIDTPMPGRAGLLLLGDAAGFIDPMTGDGIRLALASAEVAADLTRAVLGGRCTRERAPALYARTLTSQLGTKRLFNRAMRRLVASPGAVTLAARAAARWPTVLQAAIRYAGDAAPGSRA